MFLPCPDPPADKPPASGETEEERRQRGQLQKGVVFIVRVGYGREDGQNRPQHAVEDQVAGAEAQPLQPALPMALRRGHPLGMGLLLEGGETLVAEAGGVLAGAGLAQGFPTVLAGGDGFPVFMVETLHRSFSSL